MSRRFGFNRELFTILWVLALLFVVAVLLATMSAWDPLVRGGAVILVAAMAALFVLHIVRLRKSYRLPEPAYGREEDELLASVSVMVVNRLKEMESEVAEGHEMQGSLGEQESRLRQARDFSISTAIAGAPDIVRSRREVIALSLNRAWKISRLRYGAALYWTGPERAEGRVYATSGADGNNFRDRVVAVPPAAREGLEAGGIYRGGDLPLLFGDKARAQMALAVGRGKSAWGFFLLEDSDAREVSPMQETYLLALARETAAALEAMTIWRRARRELTQVLETLGDSIDARRMGKEGRGKRVAVLLSLASEEAGLTEAEREAAYAAAYLMDLGEIGVPELVLNKKDELSPREKKFVEGHPALSARLLRSFILLESVEGIVISHHERWDGNGYPLRIAQEEIPRAARLLAVCDSLEAMLAERPHRNAFELSEALTRLRAAAGTQFDPAMVEAVIKASQEWFSRVSVLSGTR